MRGQLIVGHRCELRAAHADRAVAAGAERLLNVERVATGVAAAGDDRDRRHAGAAKHGEALVVGLNAGGIVDRHRSGIAARRAGKRHFRGLVRANRRRGVAGGPAIDRQVRPHVP